MKCEWREVKLQDISLELSDGLHKAPIFYPAGEYIFVNATNIENGRIVEKDSSKKTSLEEFLKYGVELTDRTILYSIDGTIGNIAKYRGEKCLLGKGACYITLDNSVDVDYIYYLLQSPIFNEYIHIMSTGSTIKHISLKTMRNFTFPLPPIAQQKAIGSVLSSIDNKIELNNKINENLERQAQAVYHKQFETVDIDKLPTGWRVVALGDVAIISKKSFNPSKEPEAILEHYSIPAFDESRFPVFELSTAIKSNKFVVDNDCFMISKLNPTTKRVWRPYCLTENAVCSTEFIVYKAKDSTITDFLYSVIDSISFSDFMCSHVTGSTGSRQRTTPSDTLAFEFVLPSEDELNSFQALVLPMYAQMRINTIQNDKLKRLRDSLLPKLMSGEIDVEDVNI